MKYGIEMDSGAMIHTRGFIRTGSAIQKMMRGEYTDSMKIA
jgi:hypothetical protein